MKTLVVSDLHLGSAGAGDVLRRAELREPLLAALDGVERLVLLGDVVELRELSLQRALAIARPFFEALGKTLGERPVVIVPGNHDYQLVSPWLERRLASIDPPLPLELEQVLAPAEGSGAVETIAAWLGPAPLSIAYPGLWLADGVYATHGHYLDRHATTPTFERIAARVVERMVGPAASLDDEDGGLLHPDAYEAALAPVYALLYTAAQAAGEDGMGGSGASQRAWKLLGGDREGRPKLRWMLAGSVGLPAVVAALNRAGMGPFSADLRGAELRRSVLRAMGDVVASLDLSARHVVFGHSHRAGPLKRDDASEWVAPDGTRLINCGCWVFDPVFVGPTGARSPYWPGSCVLIEDGEEPELRQLLGDRDAAELR